MVPAGPQGNFAARGNKEFLHPPHPHHAVLHPAFMELGRIRNGGLRTNEPVGSGAPVSKEKVDGRVGAIPPTGRDQRRSSGPGVFNLEIG